MTWSVSSQLPRLAKTLVSRRRGALIALRLTERGRALLAWCPDDKIFTLSRELVLDRIYERGVVTFHEGMGTVVDAGAHVGIFSLQASQWAERVVALEPSQVNFRLLALNVDQNELHNVEARHCALWSTSTDALRFSTTHHSGGGSVGERRQDPDGVVTDVPATSLDDLISELGHVDLLKIDIEGAEYAVLGACKRLGSISRIVGEAHVEDEDGRAQLDALVTQLQDSGFSVSLVPEAELLSRGRLRRLWRNRAALTGHGLVKVLAAAYYLAPIKKPIRPPGATYELPILVAHR
ncbi:MAG: FkbM family methyltransferase [Acidimicrobiales bacterium]